MIFVSRSFRSQLFRIISKLDSMELRLLFSFDKSSFSLDKRSWFDLYKSFSTVTVCSLVSSSFSFSLVLFSSCVVRLIDCSCLIIISFSLDILSLDESSSFLCFSVLVFRVLHFSRALSSLDSDNASLRLSSELFLRNVSISSFSILFVVSISSWYFSNFFWTFSFETNDSFNLYSSCLLCSVKMSVKFSDPAVSICFFLCIPGVDVNISDEVILSWFCLRVCCWLSNCL